MTKPERIEDLGRITEMLHQVLDYPIWEAEIGDEQVANQLADAFGRLNEIYYLAKNGTDDF